jgi:hypothetical protein
MIEIGGSTAKLQVEPDTPPNRTECASELAYSSCNDEETHGLLNCLQCVEKYWEKTRARSACMDKREFAKFCSEKELAFMARENRHPINEEDTETRIRKAYHMFYSGLAGFVAAISFVVARSFGVIEDASRGGNAHDLAPRDAKKRRSMADIDDIDDEEIDDIPMHFTASSGNAPVPI